MFRTFLKTLLIGAMSFATAGIASDFDVQCPPEIPAGPVRMATSNETWEGYVPSPLPLTAAGFMQAPPSMRADLKPSATTKTKSGIVVEWVFEGDYPQGKWLSCDYAGGAVSLAKRIPDAVSVCSVTYERVGKNKNSLRQVSCR